MDNAIILTIIGAYLLLVIYLSIRGYSKTKNHEDFLVAGRKAHPFMMAMSYGAAFISTSAIVGFGGMAGQ
ncbi:MAG: sodium:solute symporter family protein, partial [Clostridia bacterium]|nr:sodium:solute symporter family protein [Clostridia bacterium]